MSLSYFKKIIPSQHEEHHAAHASNDEVNKFVDQLFHFLFLPKSIEQLDEYAIENSYVDLNNSLRRLIQKNGVEAQEFVDSFFDSLPKTHQALLKDAEALYQFDPAAISLAQILASYPGFYAVAIYRIAHLINELGLPILARQMSEYAHGKTAIDIHPAAKIGASFLIDHGTGVVIGETTEIGNNVKIYHGVTLGAMYVAKELAGQKRHPTIEDNVIIYAGSTILGGQTIIGRNSVIGGSVWLTHSVPEDSIVYHKSTVAVKNQNSLKYKG